MLTSNDGVLHMEQIKFELVEDAENEVVHLVVRAQNDNEPQGYELNGDPDL